MEHPIKLLTEDMVDTVDTVDIVDIVVQHLSEEDQHHSEVAQYHSEVAIMDLTEVDITVDRTEVGHSVISEELQVLSEEDQAQVRLAEAQEVLQVLEGDHLLVDHEDATECRKQARQQAAAREPDAN